MNIFFCQNVNVFTYLLVQYNKLLIKNTHTKKIYVCIFNPIINLIIYVNEISNAIIK